MKKTIIISASLVVLSVFSLCQAEVLYSITDLGPSQAWAINDNGLAVGVRYGPPLEMYAVLLEEGSMTDLDFSTLGEVVYGIAEDINNNEQIVAFTTRGDVLYENGTVTRIPGLGGIKPTHVSAINNNGQIVGSSGTSSYDTHAFLYDSGVTTDLGTLGGVDSSHY